MKTVNFKLMLVVLLASFAFACGVFIGAPSDKTMEERFRSGERDFNKLIRMFEEDNLFELTSEAAYLASQDENERGVKTELPAERMKEYRRLLRQASVYQAIKNNQQISLNVFEKDSWWFLSEYQLKSYVYTENTPSTIVDSLDKKEELPHEDYLIDAYKKIGDNWYLNFRGGKEIPIF